MLTNETFANLLASIPEFDLGYYDQEALRARVEEANRGNPHILTIPGNEEGETHAFSISHEREGAFYIWMVGVSPQARGRGLAKTLIGQCIEEARRRSIKTVTVKTHSNTPAMIRTLEQLGFTVRSTEEAEATVNGVQEHRTIYRYALEL